MAVCVCVCASVWHTHSPESGSQPEKVKVMRTLEIVAGGEKQAKLVLKS